MSKNSKGLTSASYASPGLEIMGIDCLCVLCESTGVTQEFITNEEPDWF